MNAEPDLAGLLPDLQALIASGFSRLRCGRAILLSVPGQAGARLLRELVREILDKDLVLNASVISGRQEDCAPEAVAVAFSYHGFLAMDACKKSAHPFPSPFREGMASTLREKLLGDETNSSWDWGDVARGNRFVVDCLLVHYWAESHTPTSLLDPAKLAGGGLEVKIIEFRPVCIDASGVSKEAFGFRDGISQPVIKGLRPDSRRRRAVGTETMANDRLIEPGEFILGHRNEYGERAYCPDVDDVSPTPQGGQVERRFGFNGSYLAVRQIGQDVESLNSFERQFGGSPGDITVVEKFVGRRRDGSPLSACPCDPDDADSFRYRMDDSDGFGCPRGAHIRRANPRDALGHDVSSGVEMSRLHRLLRRGRQYEKPGSDWPVGLFFMALNADLDRQFEFVQQRWLMGDKFSDLADETDPLLGPPGRAFTVQGRPVGTRFERLPAFTRVFGGGYFFLPSLTALGAIAPKALNVAVSAVVSSGS